MFTYPWNDFYINARHSAPNKRIQENHSHNRGSTRQMYFLALRNARWFSALHTDVLVFVAWVIFDSVRDYLLSGI